MANRRPHIAVVVFGSDDHSRTVASSQTPRLRRFESSLPSASTQRALRNSGAFAGMTRVTRPAQTPNKSGSFRGRCCRR
eukprot:13290780-Heterocapsa_arctica.AAC.1